MNPVAWLRNRAKTDEGVQALRIAAADAQRSRLPQMAAALSFRTIFGLIPMVVVGLLVVHSFLKPEDRTGIIRHFVNYAGLSSIEVSGLEPAARTGDPAAPEAAIEVDTTGPLLTDFQVPRDESGALGLEGWISTLINKAGSGVSLGAIGIVGLLTLVYAALAMLVEIERAFNQVYRVPRGRSWVRRVVNYWALLTLGGIGLAATFYVGTKFQVWAKEIVDAQGFSAGSGAFTVKLIGYAVTVFISTALLTLVYATVPNTRVSPGAAAGGAIVAALLWEAGKWGFSEYISYATGYAKLYGSLALIPLFMLWVYYTWLIVLFGLAATYQLQHGRSKTSAQPLPEMGPTIVEPSACLLVMTAMARAMNAGAPQSIATLARTTGLPEPIVALVVGRFAERGLLLRVERHGDAAEPVYTLARSPAAIRVGEVLSLAFELAGGPESNPVVARMRRAQTEAAGAETLADLAGGPADAPRGTGQSAPAERPVAAPRGVAQPSRP